MSMLDEMYEQALEGMDERIDVSWYNRLTVYNSEHFYTKVDRVEVHRVLSEGDASRLNRGRPESEAALRYRPSDTYHGFDSVEDARAAGEVALADLYGERVGFDTEGERMLVIRDQGTWRPVSMGEYWALVDAAGARV